MGYPVPLSPTGGDEPALFLYDAYPGGTGLSEKLFADAPILLQRAYQLVARCDCEKGCPSCVGAPDESASVNVKDATLQLFRYVSTTKTVVEDQPSR